MKLKKSLSTSLSLISLLTIKIDQSSGTCTRSPSVIGYSRPHGVLVSSYKFTWKSARCNDDGIVQYQIQFTESCSTMQPVTVLTGNNRTSTIVVIPSCAATDCYFRVRAELTDGSFTDYSTCAVISNQFLEHERQIQQFSEDECVPIQGPCSNGAAPEFFINEQLTLWPYPGTQQYNVTYSSGTYKFCFINITEHVVLSEYCYQHHSADCSLCSIQSGEIVFRSRSEIALPRPPLYKLKSHTIANNVIVTPTSIPDQNYTSVNSLGRTKSYDNNMDIREPPQLTIVGAVSIGVACCLFGTTLIATAISLWCYKNRKKGQFGNMYDKPSIPNPIYQELNIKGVSEPNTVLEMKENDAYCQVNQ